MAESHIVLRALAGLQGEDIRAALLCVRGAAQSEVDRSDVVFGTRFGMSASPIGRKRIAHRFIGGFWCENRMSPVRDGRAGLWFPTFSFAPSGALAFFHP